MKINALENLILSQLGANQQSVSTSTYPTPTNTPIQPVLEVKDSLGQKKQSAVATPQVRPAQSVQQPITKPLQTVPAVQPEANVLDSNTTKSEYALKIDNILKTLVQGRDFCKLPGVKNPVLLRSGLVKILRALDYKYSFKLVDKQLADGILTYSIEATVIDSDGGFIGSAIGSSNSGEKKFADKGLSSDNILSAIASTRALRSAVKDILVR